MSKLSLNRRKGAESNERTQQKITGFFAAPAKIAATSSSDTGRQKTNIATENDLPKIVSRKSPSRKADDEVAGKMLLCASTSVR
jgi:hypothetical protein